MKIFEIIMKIKFFLKIIEIKEIIRKLITENELIYICAFISFF